MFAVRLDRTRLVNDTFNVIFVTFEVDHTVAFVSATLVTLMILLLTSVVFGDSNKFSGVDFSHLTCHITTAV